MIEAESIGVVGPKAIKELMAAGGISNASVRCAPRGLVVLLKVGANERVMGLFRGGVRYFQSMDGAAGALRQYGVLQFDVDATGWVPWTLTRGKSKEPDEHEN